MRGLLVAVIPVVAALGAGCSDDAERPAVTETTGTVAAVTASPSSDEVGGEPTPPALAEFGAPPATCDPYEPAAPPEVDGRVLVTLAAGSVAVDTSRPARAGDALLYVEALPGTPILDVGIVVKPDTAREPRLDDGSLDLRAVEPGGAVALVDDVRAGDRCAIRLDLPAGDYVLVAEGLTGLANLWAVVTVAG